MNRYLLLANGPGEVWGWARPLMKEMMRRCIALEICLLPCQFASGHEKEALIREFPHEIWEWSWKKSPVFLPLPPFSGVIQLGGDLLFGRFFSRRYRCPLGVYTYGWRKGLSKCLFVATAFEAMAKNLQEKGVTPVLTGDLVASALQEDLGDFRWYAQPGRRIAFFPGSREAIRRAAFSYGLRFRERLLELLPDVEITVLLSPFSDSEEIPLWEKAGFRVVAKDTRGVLENADMAVTQPGTNTLELLHMGLPGIVAVPESFFDLVPLPGILGTLEKVLPLGGVARKVGLYRLKKKKTPYLGWPNRLAKEEIIPERIGPYSPRDLAEEAWDLLKNRERRQKIALALRNVAGTGHSRSARVLVDIIEEKMG